MAADLAAELRTPGGWLDLASVTVEARSALESELAAQLRRRGD